MNFMQQEYIFPLLIIMIFILVTSIKLENKFFQWVRDHWFFKRSYLNILGSLFYYIGLFLIGLALLDLRGKEENIQGKVTDQKTIVLIDSSASMLAEDIRPNRFQKSIVLAKHFVRKAIGQQISVSVFSDTQKRIIPFTNDIDLIDARLNALYDMQLERGGTGLSLAIQESIQYFREQSDEISGNILIFTDAEETDGGITLDIPSGVTVGIVGVGTAKGAPIPIRNRANVFVGNKKFNGEVVITKLDENFIKKIGKEIKDFKYWIAGSYTLPTEEIINFFNRIHKVKESKNNFRIKPVLQNYLMIPGVILLIFSFLFKNTRSFIYVGLILLCNTNSFSQDNQEEEEKKKSNETIALEEKFAEGRLSYDEKRLLANKLLQEGFSDQSKALYSEILGKEINEENKADFFNYGASQFKEKDIAGGFDTYKKLYDYLEDKVSSDDPILKSVKENMLKAIQGSAGKSGKKNQEDEKNDEKDNQDGEGEGNQDKEDKNQKNQNQKSKDQKGNKNEDQKDDQKNDEGDKDKNDNKDKDGKDKDDEKENDKKNKDGKSEGNVDKKKVPAIMKQLMSDDNKLQKQMIDTGTTERKTREKRDW